jgi:hypothetical protein
LESLKGRDPSEDISMDEGIVLNHIFQKEGNRVGGCGLDSCGSRYRPMAGSCGHSNEPLGSINDREFLD